MRSCCRAKGTISSHLWWDMIEDNVRKRIYVYMYNWVTLLNSRNWQNTKSTIMEKIKIIKLKKIFFQKLLGQVLFIQYYTAISPWECEDEDPVRPWESQFSDKAEFVLCPYTCAYSYNQCLAFLIFPTLKRFSVYLLHKVHFNHLLCLINTPWPQLPLTSEPPMMRKGKQWEWQAVVISENKTESPICFTSCRNFPNMFLLASVKPGIFSLGGWAISYKTTLCGFSQVSVISWAVHNISLLIFIVLKVCKVPSESPISTHLILRTAQ